MLGPSALLALEITTSTPDALCPPLEEARAAVRTRVGEVRGAYQAEFSLVRADDGRQSLDLVVSERGVVRLQRSLPLEGVGCEDAAQAIALVLERYFDTVESPARAPSSDLGPVAVSAEKSPSHHASPSAVREGGDGGALRLEQGAPRLEQTLRRLELRAGITYDAEFGFGPGAGISYYPSGWRVASRSGLGLALDAVAFVEQTTESVREQEILESTWQTAISLPWRLSLSRFSLAFGPWAQLRLQKAEGPNLQNGRTVFRVLPGLGGAARAAWSFHRDWAMGADVAFGAQLTGLAPSFVLRQDAEGSEPVLVSEPWFVQARLAVILSL